MASATSGPGAVVGFIAFNAGVSPPAVQASYGVGPITEVTPLQVFEMTPSEAVTGGGLMPDVVAVPPLAGGRMCPMAQVYINGAPAAGTCRVAICRRAGGGDAFRVSLVDMTGALANAAAGDVVEVTFIKMNPA